jgi:hypothetical protein
MKNDKLFQFDFISLFAIFSLIILALCINTLIEIKYNAISTEKDILYAWIRVVSSFLLCLTAMFNLRNKRKNEDKPLKNGD